MLTDRQIQALGEIYQKRMEELSAQYLIKMGEHLKRIGTLSPSDVHRLTELRRAGANVEQIRRAIAEAAGQTAREIESLFTRVAEDNYKFAEQYYAKGRQIPIRQNPALMKILKAQARQTAAELLNLSQTTIESGLYRKAVDSAVQAGHSGVSDYNSAIRQTIRQVGSEGLRVKYPSGLSRRLDTAVRQNVLDGTRQVQAAVMAQVGKEFGADGVELSAHALCAEDHLPYQGRQFSSKEFERLQALLARPIGQWNCKHVAQPILLGISEPAYSEEELEGFRKNSEEKITIDGVTKTRYEWSQEQRKIESAIRERKDVANLAKASGDDVLRRQAQYQINQLDAMYGKISDGAGLIEQRERLSVAGFRKVKTFDGLSDAARFKGAVFETEKLLEKHVAKHLAEYGSISAEEYVARAEKLLRSAPSDDILSLTRSDRSISKYRVSTNEFVVGTRDGKIKTAFKPQLGADYWWNEEVKRNE